MKPYLSWLNTFDNLSTFPSSFETLISSTVLLEVAKDVFGSIKKPKKHIFQSIISSFKYYAQHSLSIGKSDIQRILSRIPPTILENPTPSTLAPLIDTILYAALYGPQKERFYAKFQRLSKSDQSFLKNVLTIVSSLVTGISPQTTPRKIQKSSTTPKKMSPRSTNSSPPISSEPLKKTLNSKMDESKKKQPPFEKSGNTLGNNPAENFHPALVVSPTPKIGNRPKSKPMVPSPSKSVQTRFDEADEEFKGPGLLFSEAAVALKDLAPPSHSLLNPNQNRRTTRLSIAPSFRRTTMNRWNKNQAISKRNRIVTDEGVSGTLSGTLNPSKSSPNSSIQNVPIDNHLSHADQQRNRHLSLSSIEPRFQPLDEPTDTQKPPDRHSLSPERRLSVSIQTNKQNAQLKSLNDKLASQVQELQAQLSQSNLKKSEFESQLQLEKFKSQNLSNQVTSITKKNSLLEASVAQLQHDKIDTDTHQELKNQLEKSHLSLLSSQNLIKDLNHQIETLKHVESSNQTLKSKSDYLTLQVEELEKKSASLVILQAKYDSLENAHNTRIPQLENSVSSLKSKLSSKSELEVQLNKKLDQQTGSISRLETLLSEKETLLLAYEKVIYAIPKLVMNLFSESIFEDSDDSSDNGPDDSGVIQNDLDVGKETQDKLDASQSPNFFFSTPEDPNEFFSSFTTNQSDFQDVPGDQDSHIPQIPQVPQVPQDSQHHQQEDFTVSRKVNRKKCLKPCLQIDSILSIFRSLPSNPNDIEMFTTTLKDSQFFKHLQVLHQYLLSLYHNQTVSQQSESPETTETTETQINNLNQLLTKTNQENGDLQARLNVAEQSVQKLKIENTKLCLAIDNDKIALKRLVSVESTNSQLELQVSQLESKLEILNGELKSSNEKILFLQNQILDEKHKTTHLETKIVVDTQSNIDDIKSGYATQLKAKDTEIQQLESQISSLKDQVENITTQCNQLRTVANRDKNQALTSQKEATDSLKKMQEIQFRKSQLEAKIVDLETQIDQISTSSSSYDTTIKTLEETLKSTQKDYQDALSSHSQEIEKYVGRIELLTKTNSQLSVSLQTTQNDWKVAQQEWKKSFNSLKQANQQETSGQVSQALTAVKETKQYLSLLSHCNKLEDQLKQLKISFAREQRAMTTIFYSTVAKYKQILVSQKIAEKQAKIYSQNPGQSFLSNQRQVYQHIAESAPK